MDPLDVFLQIAVFTKSFITQIAHVIFLLFVNVTSMLYKDTLGTKFLATQVTTLVSGLPELDFFQSSKNRNATLVIEPLKT